MDSEIEVKFFLTKPKALENRLRSLGATLTQIQTYEVNLRFDTSGRELTKDHRVLRLRQDTHGYLTYKGPSQGRDDVSARQEIEFGVSDFQATRRLLEALGYQLILVYEKNRTTYEIDSVKVTLDEMPFGLFCEIEGPEAAAIQSTAERLGLSWPARNTDSYVALFDCLKERLGLAFRDLTFGNFEALKVTPEDLGVRPADV